MIEILQSALEELVYLPQIQSVIMDNIEKDKGNEERVYPYLNRLVLSKFIHSGRDVDDIIGIGYEKVGSANDKVDFSLLVRENGVCERYIIELKGPSWSKSYIKAELTKDLAKMTRLKSDANNYIVAGIAAGIEIYRRPREILATDRIIKYGDAKKAGVRLNIQQII